MKNKEAYKTLINSITENREFGYRVNRKTGIISSCNSEMNCDSCMFWKRGDIFIYDECSRQLIEAWENTEYGESFTPVVWYFVPVDAQIQVCCEDHMWVNRHFAKYENGRVYAWPDGQTSWTVKDPQDATPWSKARLVERLC